jgi:hypothetical protein
MFAHRRAEREHDVKYGPTYDRCYQLRRNG